MRLVVFSRYRRSGLGQLEPDGRIIDLVAAAAAWLALEEGDPFADREAELRLPADVGRFLAGGTASCALAKQAADFARRRGNAGGVEGEPLLLEPGAVRLRAPLLSPLVLSSGATFAQDASADSAERLEHREFFLRDPFNLLAPGDEIALPAWLGKEFEAAPRLAVVIGKSLRSATRAEAEEGIFGYCPALEICVRDLHLLSWAGALFHIQYPHARAFDGSLLLGAAVVGKEEVGTVANRKARLRTDDQAQEGPVPGRWDELVDWICRLSNVVTLPSGTLLIPGSADETIVQPTRAENAPIELRIAPSLSMPLKGGETLWSEIEGVGRVEARVRLRAAPPRADERPIP